MNLAETFKYKMTAVKLLNKIKWQITGITIIFIGESLQINYSATVPFVLKNTGVILVSRYSIMNNRTRRTLVRSFFFVNFTFRSRVCDSAS